MTTRPSPSRPRNTQQQHKPGPRGSSEHWRRTRNHYRPPPWPASWQNQASGGDSSPPTNGLSTCTSKPATSNEQAACLNDAAGPPSSGGSPPQAAAGSRTTTRHRPAPRPRQQKHNAGPNRPGARPPNGTRHWTRPAPPSTARLRGSAANAPLTSSEISAAPWTRSAPSSTSARRGSARTSSGTRRCSRRHEPMPTAGQLAVDAPVAPSRVVPPHLQHQRPYGRRSPGAPRPARGVGPVLPDEVSVPAQQGPRGNDQPQLAELAVRQQPGQSGQHRAVGPRQPRARDLTLEHGDLMPQDQDLSVLGTI